MMCRRGICAIESALLFLLLFSPLWAQEVGTVVQGEGDARIVRGEHTIAATAGMAVQMRDGLQTGDSGRIWLVFQDDSVLNLAPGSSVVINEQVFQPEQGKSKSYFELLKGKLHSYVSEYYAAAGAEYEVETSTATIGVRGTEFVIVFDPVAEVTEVVGVGGQVTVRSVLGRAGREVLLSAQERARVVRGAEPSAPVKVSAAEIARILQEFHFLQTRVRSVDISAVSPPANAAETDAEEIRNLRVSPADLIGQPIDVLQGHPSGVHVSF